jgi:hypothetical protein
MAMTTAERSRRANAAKSAKAKRRRWMKALQEMRDDGLVVEVQTTEFYGPIVHPDYTAEAVRKALGR